MGGRGASSGISANGKPYGSEYKSVLTSGNIKFVSPTDGHVKAPLETMTSGRIYVTIGSDGNPRYISYYDKRNKKHKQIDIRGKAHTINGKKSCRTRTRDMSIMKKEISCFLLKKKKWLTVC